jgi:exodeoxyribonuclease V beta subunit
VSGAAFVPLRGLTAIEASAGTGKTFTIEQLYLRLVVEEGYDVASILVVTYTKAATAELRTRIRRRLERAAEVLAGRKASTAFYDELRTRIADPGEAVRAIERALQGFDEAAIFTIHGFCQRVLAERAFESGVAFDAEVVPDQDDLLLEVVDDFWRRTFAEASAGFAAHLVGPAKWTPEKLRDDLRLQLGRRWARIVVPAAVPALAPLEAAEADALARVRAAWPAARARIVALVDGGRLGGKIQAKARDKLVADMDALARGEGPCGSLFKYFDRLVNAPGGAPDACLAACEALQAAVRARDAAYDARARALRADLLAFAEREMGARKVERRMQFYDDLLLGLARALEDGVRGPRLAEAVRRRYPAALIDEFQDTDPVQYAIVRRIYGDSAAPVVLVGDPKQAIYSFRAADVFSYLRARADARTRVPLDVNWRAVAPLVDAVNRVFGNRERAFVLRDIPFEPAAAAPAAEAKIPVLAADDGAAALRVWWIGDGPKALGKGEARERIYGSTASEIVRLLDRGRQGKATLGEKPLAGGDVAVLVRTNEEGKRMREALLRRGVPSVQQAVDSVFASREAEEIERLLLAVAEPGQAPLVRAALVTEMLGGTADEIERLAGDDLAWDRRIETFHEYHHRARTHGFVAMMRELMVRERVAERLLAFPDGERRLTNVFHVVELLQTIAMRRRGGLDALVEWLADARQVVRPPEMVGEEHLVRLESDADLVTIVTVHKAKGLQYPVVFCPFLWDGRLFADHVDAVVYHEDDGDGATLDLVSAKGEPGRRRARTEELAERLRLLYVALTRAQNRCYLVWGHVNEGGTSPLAWLFHAGAAVDIEGVEARYDGAGTDALRAEIQAVAAGSGGTMALSAMPPESPARHEGTSLAPATLAARRLARPVGRGFTVASFSALVAESDGLERHDYDQHVEAADDAAANPRDAHGFPRGPRAGRCLHAILEAADFAALDPADVAARLRGWSIDAAWTPIVVDWLGRVVATPLDADGRFRLVDVPRARRVDELEFYYPVTTLDVSVLVRRLMDAGFGDGAFADAAARLPAARVHGFLRGFVDAVVEHDGRYFVVDYKSNRLGDSLDAYAAAALVPEIARGHYWLQYLIYTVAVHRWLGRRLRGYDYDRHFGGVRYLFLRGMDPARGVASGVHVDRPSRAVVELVDGLLGGRPA